MHVKSGVCLSNCPGNVIILAILSAASIAFAVWTAYLLAGTAIRLAGVQLVVSLTDVNIRSDLGRWRKIIALRTIVSHYIYESDVETYAFMIM